MIFPSVDNFLKIFNFYQLNSIRSVKVLTKSSFKFNTLNKFFEALNFNYENDLPGLTYPQHKDEILQAISSRLDLSKYFNGAGFPGSYAFNTADCFMFKTIMLDWASTIKVFQDSTSQCTNVYRLSSTDVDKAIRGFGIDFINERTVSSLNRRQTFLLNMCDLYKIKGSPQSIIKALNIIGLEDIYITEAWVYPTRDGDQNVEIKWIPVKQPQEFDPETNSYTDPNVGMDVEYWSWGRFTSKIDSILECHWFYKKFEIIDLNWHDPNTYFHLPSLTPYFNIKIKFDNMDQTSLLKVVNGIINKQAKDYLSGGHIPEDVSIEGYNYNCNFISTWLGFIYSIVTYADFLRYNELKKFTKKYGFTGLDYDGIQNSNKYLQLIYRVYTYINSKSDVIKKIYSNTLENYFTVTSVPIGYCSYEEVKYWWLTTPHTQQDTDNGLDAVREIITPSNCKITVDGNHLEVYWNDKYNYGYYDIEVKIIKDGYIKWVNLESNCEIKSQSMQRIIPLMFEGNSIYINDLMNCVRIVHYHTENNIPSIFFQRPFYFGQGKQDTLMDMIYYYNNDIIHDAFYKQNPIYKISTSSSYGVSSTVTDFDLIQNNDKYINNLPQRNVDRDYQYRTFMNSFLDYPTSLFDIDKDIIRETVYKKYINDLTYNYKDFISHDAEKLYYINNEKYPQNKKWNWGISYGSDDSTTYYFINYEGKKWCRIKSDKLFIDKDINLSHNIIENDYGVPLYKDKQVFIHVTTNNSVDDKGGYFKIDNTNSCLLEDEWNALIYTNKQFDYNSKLENDFKNEYGIDYRLNNDKITVTLPPSDIFPNSIIESHTFNDKQFYFSDTVFKPDSKLAKCVVVGKINSDYCRRIYQQISDTYNDQNVDSNSSNNFSYEYIPVYKDPFNTNVETLYKFEDLLRYLYINSYVLDYTTGYIYKQFNYYLDEQYNYLYIKCIDLNDNDVSDSIVYKWVRVKVSREWDYEENRKSIYYKLDSDCNYVQDVLNRRVPCVHTGDCDFLLNYKRVYDSARYLRDPILKDNKYEYLPENINKVLSISNKNYVCKVKYDIIDSYGNIAYTYINEDKQKCFIYNKDTKESIQILPYSNEPLINDVNYGINPDLYDYINAQFNKYEANSEQYENVIIQFAEALQEYFKKNKYNVTLDIYNAHIFNSRLVRNIVNFYKPKRDRMLNLMSQMELENEDRILCDISDINYNPIYLNHYQNYKSPIYNKKENGLSNKTKIKQQIDEYVPLSDLIFLKENIVNNEVVNYREVYPYFDNYNPKLEVFDKIDNLNNYKIVSDKGTKYSTYYCSDFDEQVNGFYFHDIDYPITYTNGYYYFINKNFSFLCNYNEDGSKKETAEFITVNRWFCFELSKKEGVMYHAAYISDKKPSNVPYLDTDGNELKYTKIPSNINNYDDIVLYLSNAIYDKGIFQYKTDKNNGYIRVGLHYVDPVFYMGNFEDDKYNGYYYIDSKSRFGQPIYKNKNGKMISYYDLSYLPDRYLQFSIEEYHKENCNKYWIITDYCQIPDISDATYIAYCTEDSNSIFEDNNDTTKTFYKLNPIKKGALTDILFVCGIYGHATHIMLENPHLLTKNDQLYHKKYDLSKEYTKYINRKIFQGDLPVKYEPISYIDFYYNHSLRDTYVYNDKYITDVIVTDIDKGIVTLDKSYYGMDYWNNQHGSLYINGRYISITFKNNKPIKDVGGVFLRIKSNYIINDHLFICNDLDWHTYFFKYDNNSIKLYIDGKFSKNIEDLDINNITINNVYISICEYAVFDKNIPDWYLEIIHNYGIYTYRKEQSKLYGSKLKNNYTPLFNTETPRNCYGKYVTGLPENIEGDRFSSSVMNYDFTYDLSHYDGFDRYNTNKWNAASYYNPKQTRELSMLWSKKTANRVYDRNVMLTTDSEGKITGVTIDRKYVDNRLKLNNLENIYCEKQRYMLCDGQEFAIPSNYISPYSTYIPVWWNKKPEDYKTGSVHHRPVTIAIKEKYDEYYPVVTNGGKKGKYFDEGLSFDGGLISCCNPHVFNTSEVDENTGYVSTLNKFESDLVGKTYTKRRIVETRGDGYLLECSNTESNIFYDPNMQYLTQEMKDNHIYHTSLMLDKCENFAIDISGKYLPKKIDSIYKQQYDFDYCYSNIKKYNIDKIRTKINNNDLILNGDTDLYSETIAVLTYDNMCRYYIWEIRNYNHKLTRVKSNDTIKTTNFVDKNNNPYYYNVIKTNVATNYVKCRYIINNPEDRFYKLKDVYPLRDYSEVVDIAINYGALHFVDVDKLFNYSKIKKLYEDIAYISLPTVEDVFDEALNVKYKYFEHEDFKLNKMYYVHNNYDYINQLQLDLCNQKLCTWDDNLKEELRTKQYRDVKQNIVDNLFRSYSILKFKLTSSNLIKYTDDKNITSNYYILNNKLYIRYRSTWYGEYKYTNITNKTIKNKLNNLCCHIYNVYDGTNLYVRTENKGWVNAHIQTGKYSVDHSIYNIYMDDKTNILINVPYTNSELDDWNYYVDEEKIQATVMRYKKLYNRGHDQLGYFGQELQKDPMDDVYFGKGNHETILDRLYIYVYGICNINKNYITLNKPSDTK